MGKYYVKSKTRERGASVGRSCGGYACHYGRSIRYVHFQKLKIASRLIPYTSLVFFFAAQLTRRRCRWQAPAVRPSGPNRPEPLSTDASATDAATAPAIARTLSPATAGHRIMFVLSYWWYGNCFFSPPRDFHWRYYVNGPAVKSPDPAMLPRRLFYLSGYNDKSMARSIPDRRSCEIRRGCETRAWLRVFVRRLLELLPPILIYIYFDN